MTARELRLLVCAAAAWADTVEGGRRKAPLNTRHSMAERREIARNIRIATAELGRIADRSENTGPDRLLLLTIDQEPDQGEGDQGDLEPEPCDQCGHEPCACCYFDDGPQDTRDL
jgi:hypothetical protein